MAIIHRILGAILLVFALVGAASAQNSAPLPIEQAFKVSLAAEANDTRVVFDITEGYYLYRDQMALTDKSGNTIALSLPPGHTKDDPTFGRTEIYTGQLSFPVPRDAPRDLTLDYQGCEDGSICYPPVRRALDTGAMTIGPVQGPNLLSASNTPKDAGLPIRIADKTGGSLLGDLATKGGVLLVVAAFLVFGVALAFTPCVFPMYPILAGTLTRSGEKLSTPKAFGISSVYVLGMAIAFGLMGIAAAWSGQNLQMVLQSAWAVGGVALLFFVLAISMFGAFELELPQSWMSAVTRVSGGNGVAGAGVMGFLSALIVGPCVTAPLAAALLYIAQTGDAVLGASALFALGIGKGIPLVIFGTLGGKVMPRAGAWMVRVKHAFGFVFIGAAIWMAGRLLPEVITLVLWSGLIAAIAIYLIAMAMNNNGLSKAAPIALGVAGLGAAGFMGLGALGIEHPLAALTFQPTAVESGTLAIDKVKGLEATEAKLTATEGMPRLVYFTADWCVSCAVIERTVWENPKALAGFEGVQLVKIDITDNTAEDQAMLKQLDAFGPPTLLFVDKTGREIEDTRLVGEFNGGDLREHARKAGFLP